jgi:hypothetical protein
MKEEALMQEDLKKHHDALAQEMKHMRTAQVGGMHVVSQQ